MGKRKNEAKSDLFTDLERFFVSRLAVSAADGLSDRACVVIHVDGQDFFFKKKSGKNQILREEPQSPDVHFWLHESTLRHILEAAARPDAGIASLGIVIFERILAKKEADKIKFRVDASFLVLWTKGYFSVLKAGGPEIAGFLSNLGFSIGKIKEILLQKFRG